MRLDKFLKVSRIIKRRTVANEVSEMGCILVNEKPAKPSKQLKVGDIITVVSKTSQFKYKVVELPSRNISIQEAPTLYEKLDWQKNL